MCACHMLLGVVPQPLSYVVGERVYGGAARVAGESAGGLFSGQSGPKPPLALSLATVGMKKGGKVRGTRVCARLQRHAAWALQP